MDEEVRDTELVTAPVGLHPDSVSSADVRGIRNDIEQAKRDLAGFIEGDTPHLTMQQAIWIATRAQFMTDAEACAQTEIQYGVVQIWKQNPDFCAILDIALHNTREGFRLLGTQMLPKTLMVIADKLDSKNERVALAAAKLLVETQGMLITTITKQSKGTMTELIAFLREPTEVEAQITARSEVRGLPSPEDLENGD